jgi:hypothetical protein
MNHQIRLAIDTDILGDCCMQERFTAYVEILRQFVLHAPRPVGIAQMTDISGIPVPAMKRYLNELGLR